MQNYLSFASLKILFYRYKDTQYYPLVNIGFLFVIACFLLFQIVIPQFSEWFSVQREVNTIKGNIKTMQENISFLSSLDQKALDADVLTITNAYPFDKDYIGIINALSKTASRTGVALPDFRLSVGDPVPGDLPVKFQMSFTFAGSLQVAKKFINELEQVLPIAAVTSINNTGSQTTVNLEFYYHGFPAITINQKEKLTPLNTKERELLARLKAWQIPVEIEDVNAGDLSDTSASSSGEFPPPL